MRVTIDEDACVGAGQCVVAASRVFDQREDDGIVILLDENPPDDQHDFVREAAARCPASVISVIE